MRELQTNKTRVNKNTNTALQCKHAQSKLNLYLTKKNMSSFKIVFNKHHQPKLQFISLTNEIRPFSLQLDAFYGNFSILFV